MDRLTLYNQLSPELKSLYEGIDERLSVLDTLFEQHNFSKENKKNLVNALGDVILGIENTRSFSDNIKQTLTPEQAAATDTALAPVLNDIAELLQSTDTITPVEVENVETPAKSPSVEPMRTMATDIEKVHGYGAAASTEESDDVSVYKTEQTSVLTRPSVATTPTYADPAPTPSSAVQPETDTTPSSGDNRWASPLEDTDQAGQEPKA